MVAVLGASVEDSCADLGVGASLNWPDRTDIVSKRGESTGLAFRLSRIDWRSIDRSSISVDSVLPATKSVSGKSDSGSSTILEPSSPKTLL
jgi:hypothetical protein